MTIEVTPTAPPEWDAYVARHPEATAWLRGAAVRIGADAFGLRTFFLTARTKQGEICGVLPLVEQSSMLLGRFLTSVPFFTYGGIVADDPSIATQLATRAGELARERRAKHVELRHSAAIPGVGLPERLDKVSMMLELPASADILSKQLGSKLRSQIRRPERENLEIAWGGAELLPEFYSVFAPAMHELGTPVYSRNFFSVVHAALADVTSVLVVRMGGVAHAAAIIVRHGSRIEVPWAASSAASKRVSLNMRMYWELLSKAIETGASTFDFGRSSVDSGTYRFKAQWGAKPHQLHWHYCLPEGASVPMLNHSNPKFARVVALWRSMPLWCANLIGPQISRYLP